MRTRVTVPEYKVLRVVRSSRKPISTNKVAERTGLSWQKAEKILMGLYRRGLVRRKQTSPQRFKWV